MTSFSDCRRLQGFTLIELLLAITIFSIVVSMVYGVYNMTFKVINSSNDHAKYGVRARVTLERFREDLESFHLGSTGFIEGDSETFGEYRADSISFTSTSHLVFTKDELPAGYATISYTVEEEEESGLLRLYRADVPFRPGQSEDEDRGFLLCDGLREVAVTYFDEDGNDTETWTSEQGNTALIPQMVQLKIGFASEESEDGTIYFSTGVAIPR